MDFYDEFCVSGPTHMMVNTNRGFAHMMVNTSRCSSPKKMIEIDWDNLDQRRCITACLVKGTYVMESDQTKVTHHAPARWESFHFRRPNVFECACKCVFCKIFGPNRWFICGAVFEYMPPDGTCRHPSAPRYIVAFRGTMPEDPTIFGDMRVNLRILLNKQQSCSRFRDARKLVEDLVNSTGDGNSTTGSVVWLVGHSLGASIALDVGRDMMCKGLSLPTFLFNPPYVSLAPVANMLGVPEKAKQDVHLGSYFVKHAIVKTILRPQKKRMEEVFLKLSPWVPELYVHQRDLICSGYIDHFELRENAQQEQFHQIARSAATLAYRDLLHPCAVSSFGDKNGERQQLLPSARLWKNSNPYGNAHELRQWWQPDLILSPKLYSWP